MAEEKKAHWLNYLSATTVVIAVSATLATFKGGGYGTRSILFQSKASDQWNYYQAKGIKQYLYEIQKENALMQLSQMPKATNDTNMAKRIADYDQKILKYKADKDDIARKAKQEEDARDECKLHQDRFGIAVIFLQIAILLSSVSAVMKNKYVWLISIALGSIGIFYFLDGFYLFY